MKLHANARTCPHSRALMVRRVEDQGCTVSKWLSAWRKPGNSAIPGLR